MENLITTLMEEIKIGKFKTIVVDSNNNVVFTANSDGVRDLNYVFHKKPEFLPSATVFKDLVGGVNAFFCIKKGVKAIYTDKISKIGMMILDYYKVEYHYNEVIDHILASNGRAMCPMEKISSEDYKDIDTAIKKIEDYIQYLKTNPVCSIF